MKLVSVWVIHPHDERLGERRRDVEAVFLDYNEASQYGVNNPCHGTPREPRQYAAVQVIESQVYLPNIGLEPLGCAADLETQARKFYAAEVEKLSQGLTETQRLLLQQSA